MWIPSGWPRIPSAPDSLPERVRGGRRFQARAAAAAPRHEEAAGELPAGRRDFHGEPVACADSVPQGFGCEQRSGREATRGATVTFVPQCMRAAASLRFRVSGGIILARPALVQRWLSSGSPPAPLDFQGPRALVAPAREHEGEVAEAVEVADETRLDALLLRQRHEAPLGAPAHRAGPVQLGGERRAPRQDEALEGRQLLFTRVDPILERPNVVLR